MTWRDEFPDYPADQMPALGAEFDDVSWHNDVCPCFRAWLDNHEHLAELWVDYPNPAQRSFGGQTATAKRFVVIIRDEDGDRVLGPNRDYEFASDNLDEALAFIAKANGQ